MKRFTVLATSLIVAGSALLPTAASASPWVTADTNGAPLDGTTGTPGLPIRVEGTGCDNTGGTAVMGQFVSPNGDPWDRPAEEELIQIELPVDAEGNFTWDVVLGNDNDNGTFTNRWYCATAPVTAMRDAEVTWVSPTATMTIEGAGGLAGGKSASRMAKGAATTPTVRIEMDPDALPAVDKIDILGPAAARLKEKVDKKAKVDKKSKSRLGRRHEAKDSKDYVEAAFDVVGGKKPSAKVVQSYVDRLEAGELKVQVVEDIALAEKPASHWNKKG